MFLLPADNGLSAFSWLVRAVNVGAWRACCCQHFPSCLAFVACAQRQVITHSQEANQRRRRFPCADNVTGPHRFLFFTGSPRPPLNSCIDSRQAFTIQPLMLRRSPCLARRSSFDLRTAIAGRKQNHATRARACFVSATSGNDESGRH